MRRFPQQNILRPICLMERRFDIALWFGRSAWLILALQFTLRETCTDGQVLESQEPVRFRCCLDSVRAPKVLDAGFSRRIMRSLLGSRASNPSVSPLQGHGYFRVQSDNMNPQKISRREWWLWFSALLVTALSAIAFLLSSIRSFFRHADHFYEIRSDQARWATLCLLLVFNVWLIYRQWSFRRLRKQFSEQSLDSQGLPQQFMETSGLDPVTGLYTRFGLEQHLGKEIARARRQNTALSLATVHVDELSQLAARCGQSAVDNALKELARRLKKASRGSDIAARLSDDDFLLLLPECGVNEVKQVLNRLGPIEVNASREKILLNYTTGWVDYQPGDLPAALLKRAADLLHLYDTAAHDSFSTTLASH
jgi:diguanylate cyclase (GGDEF)-like protein